MYQQGLFPFLSNIQSTTTKGEQKMHKTKRVYTEKEVRALINSLYSCREKLDQFQPDSPILIGIYDIEQTMPYLSKEQNTVYQYMVEGVPVNEWSNEWNTYERNIWRKQESLVKTLTNTLNHGK